MKYKKRIINIFLVMIVFSTTFLVSNFLNNKAMSYYGRDVIFTLEARGFSSKHLDYLFLMREQLLPIGINLKIEKWEPLCGCLSYENYRDFDMMILDLPYQEYIVPGYYQDNDSLFSPFPSILFSENGSLGFSGYHTSQDWNEELGTGRNEWYIRTGLQMTPNDSLERINLCREWQHYLMDEILPCLPLFTQKNNHSSFEILVFNMREVRPIIGSRDPTPLFPEKTLGLTVRKIISYAINREEIRKIVLGDDYEIINNPINPSLVDWLNPSIINYCHNLDAVGILKAIAGFDIAFCGPIDYPVNWPNWEEFCSDFPSSVTVNGFDIMITLVIVSIISAFWIIHHLRKRRKKQIC